MKVIQVLLAAFVVVLSGCASDPENEAGKETTRYLPIEPPTFLNSDVAGLFGKANFSARVEVQKGFAGARPPILGELSGRDGSLFFIADEQRSKRGFSGGLSALWDGPTQTAYLLNEPLQAYAPIRNLATNGPLEVVAAGEEDVGAEHCRKTILTRKLGGEAVPVLAVWRGTAEQELPIRIQTTNTPSTVIITLSRVRLQAPAPDMFNLPNGFKRYDSTEAMIGELMRRRTDAMTARTKMKRERYGTPTVEDDDNSHEMGKPTRPY
jgi:hypothetical protein